VKNLSKDRWVLANACGDASRTTTLSHRRWSSTEPWAESKGAR